MAEPDNEKQPAGRWQALWRRTQSKWLLGIPVGGFVFFFLGIILWGGFNTAMEVTSTETFCISCHEMKEFVYAEYKETIHFKNTAGVRATCPDCHVPKPWGHKVIRKIQATLNEVPAAILGTINTREKFEANRARLAENVWASMKASNSRECRNCHAQGYMDLENQDKRASRKHSPEWLESHDDTCIDCHKGIAHKLPEVSANNDERAMRIAAAHKLGTDTRPEQ